MRPFIAAVLVVIVAGCGGAPNDPGKPAAEKKSTLPAVDWQNYDPSVKQRIDDAAARKVCDELQHEFDVADANNAIQRNRTGDGNTDLMEYVDAKMKSAGCYN